MNKKRLYTALSFIVIVGLALIYYSYPSPKEFALMYLQDGRYVESYELFSKLYEQGDRTSDVLVNLVNLDIFLGYTKDAVSKMELLLQLYPDYPYGREKLGQLYKHDNRTADYILNLEKIVDKNPTRENIEELIALYQQYSMRNKLGGAYEKLLATGVREESYLVDYAEFLADQNKLQRAIDVLSLKPIADYKDLDNVELYLNLLLDEGQVERAVEESKKYLAIDSSDKAILSVSYFFEEHKQPQEGFTLLEHYCDRFNSSPELFLQYIYLGIDLGKEDQIYPLLQDYYAKGHLPDEAVDLFLDLSIDRGNFLAMDAILNKKTLNLVTNETLLSLVEYLQQVGADQKLEFIRKEIDPKRLANAPLLEIVLFETENPSLEAFKEFYAAKNFTSFEKLYILQFVMNQDQPDIAQVVFDSIQSLEGFSSSQMVSWVKSAIALEKVESAQNLFDKFLQQHPDQPMPLVHLYLDAASNQSVKVLSALNALEPFDPLLVEDLFWIAYNKNQIELELAISKFWYEKECSEKSARAYGLALEKKGMYAEAFSILEQIIKNYQNDPELILPYASLLFHLDKMAALERFLTTVISNGEIEENIKVDLGQMMIDFKKLALAEKIYLYLTKTTHKAEYLDELLNIWQDAPPCYAFGYLSTWGPLLDVEGRILLSKYLIDIEHPEIVISYFTCEDLQNFDLSMYYMQAALIVRNSCLFDKIFDTIADIERSAEEWIYLADIAYDHGKNAESAYFYCKAHRKDPEKNYAFKRLYLSTFYQGKLLSAYEMLLEYISAISDDPLAYYYLGLILDSYGYVEEARPFFWRTVALVGEGDQVQEDQLAMDDALFSLGRRHISLCRLKELFDKDPTNLTLAYEFAIHLEAAKYYLVSLLVLNCVLTTFEEDLYLHKKDEWDSIFSLYLEKVRVLVQLWKTDQAYCLLQEIKPYICFFNDPELYWRAVSEYENKLGAWIAAMQAVEIAKEEAPWDQNLDLICWSIWEEERSYVEPSYMLRLTTAGGGGSGSTNANYTEHLSTLKFFYRHQMHWTLFNKFDEDHVSAVSYQQAKTGLFFPFKGDRYRNETDLEYEWNGGNRALLGLFVGDQVLGGQVQYVLKDLRGEFSFLFRYHYPTWDLIETIVQYGTLDTLQIGRIYNFNQYFRYEGNTAVRFWGVDHIPNVDTTLKIDWNFIYSLSFAQIQSYLGETGFVDLIYNLDAEYVTARKIIREVVTLTRIPILNILTQETHTLKAIVHFDFSKYVHSNDLFAAEGFFGYSYNRFGHGAATYGASLLYKRHWGWSVFANYSKYPDVYTSGEQVEWQIGVHYPF